MKSLGTIHWSLLVVKLQRGTCASLFCHRNSSCARLLVQTDPYLHRKCAVCGLFILARMVFDSMWAITGKQYWRCGMNRKYGYGVRMLAHPDPRKDVVCSR